MMKNRAIKLIIKLGYKVTAALEACVGTTAAEEEDAAAADGLAVGSEVAPVASSLAQKDQQSEGLSHLLKGLAH
jgi:hypothetical protein